MSPHELELMLFINKNFLSPSIFDKVMKWAHSATVEGTSLILQATPHWKSKWTTHSTILLLDSGALKSKVFLPDEVGSELSVTMWYFEQSFGVVCKVPLRSSSHEGLFLFSPEETFWLWIMYVQQDYISWLFLWSIQQITCNWKWNALTPVFICWYRTLWQFLKNTDWLMKNSEHPFLQTILNLTLDCCQSSDSWMMLSLTNAGSPSHGTLCTHYWRNWKGDVSPNYST